MSSQRGRGAHFLLLKNPVFLCFLLCVVFCFLVGGICNDVIDWTCMYVCMLHVSSNVWYAKNM